MILECYCKEKLDVSHLGRGDRMVSTQGKNGLGKLAMEQEKLTRGYLIIFMTARQSNQIQ